MARSRFGSRRLRYLKARLSIFTRPAFLAAAVFLSVVGFVVKEYWTNPDFFELSQIRDSLSSTPSDSQSSLSDEDRAIAADIGNLSVLDYDKQQADIPPIPTTSINDSIKVRKQNDAQLNKILDLTKKNQKEQTIPANAAKVQTPSTPSSSVQNPFLKQAEDLLKFKVNTGNLDGSTNNLSPFSSNSQTSGSFNLGINNNSFVNPNQSTNSPSALQQAITESAQKKKEQEKSAENSTTEKNKFGLPQNSQTANSPNSSNNQRLPQNQTNTNVDTTIFNQPLNTQPQNPYNNFNSFNNPNSFNNNNNSNSNQFPTNNFNQPGLNNQPQNPYGSFNNQIPSNNNQLQNPSGNFNSNQVPRNNNVQPTSPYNNFNNQNPNIQQQNPYSNFNRSQPSVNNSFQNPYNNFNNQTRVNGYSPQIQTRINNIYDRLVNRDFPGAATRNNYTAPNVNINRGFQQPNVQQFNSPYSQQNQIQYPNNGYRY